MKTMSKLSSAIFALAVMSSCLVVSWCQSCGTKSYGGSPSVEFYATKPEQPSHLRRVERLYNTVTVHPDSNITLTCTAMAPRLGLPLSPSYLQPYLINWFVNSSMIHVTNCDDKPRKMKTCSLSLVNIQPRDNGKYFCKATNELGCTYKKLRLTVTSGEQNDKIDGNILSKLTV